MPRIRIKRGTTTQWNSSTTPLLSGELGLDTTLNKLKAGNGTSLWQNLPFLTSDGGGDIADFVFTNVDETNSSITVTGNKELTIQSGSSEDLNVRAGDDLWLTADDNIVVQADDEVNLRSQGSTSILTNFVDLENDEYEWQFGSQGYLTLPGGGEIINSPDSSGDGSGYSTLQLDPDNTLETDQYIIIDPTAPNHIHIRAGGEQDASAADLFIGGERNHVRVSDGGRSVSVSTRPEQVINTYTNINPTSNTSFVVSNTASIYVGDTVFAPGGDTVTVDSVTQDSPEAGLQTITANLNGEPASFVGGAAHVFSHEESWDNYWQFGSDGVLTGPGGGTLIVSGISGEPGDDVFAIVADQNLVLQHGPGGAYLNDSTIANNQIATMGDIADANDYTDTAITSLGNTVDGAYVPVSDVGNAGGVASLDINGKIPLSELGNLIDGAPEVLNTLNELAEAINDDASYAATITTALGNKLDSNYVTIGNTLLEGISGQTYGLIGTSTYLDVKNTNGYNKEIELDIAAVKSQLDTDGYIKQAALDVKSDKIISISSKSSSYTLQPADIGTLIEMSGGGTVTITDSASFPVGFYADILQTGSTQVSVAGNGFTLNGTPGLKLRNQWSSATVIKRALNVWVLVGDLSA
jgi:hypothetical protein